MRRLAPFLIAALALCAWSAVASQGAAGAHWRWTITGGEAHAGPGNQLVGNLTIENTGNARSPRISGELRMSSDEAGFRRPAMPLVLPLAPGESAHLRFHPKAPRTYPHALWRVSFCIAIQECRHLGRVEIGGRPPLD